MHLKNPSELIDIIEDLPPEPRSKQEVVEEVKTPVPEEPPAQQVEVSAFEEVEHIDTTTPTVPATPKKPATAARETRSVRQKKSGVSANSKAISKITPVEYLTNLCKKHPKSMHRLCKLRETTKMIKRSMPEIDFGPYKILAADPMWMDPESEPIDLIDDQQV